MSPFSARVSGGKRDKQGATSSAGRTEKHKRKVKKAIFWRDGYVGVFRLTAMKRPNESMITVKETSTETDDNKRLEPDDGIGERLARRIISLYQFNYHFKLFNLDVIVQ